MSKDLKVLITSGGTRERIDPVRYIGNFSSGKMGAALVKAFKSCTNDITVISGSATTNYETETIWVESAQDMLAETLTHIKDADVVICAAAVADKRPDEYSEHKIKKDQLNEISLVDNRDILQTICNLKKRPKVIIGFAAESENHIKNARLKLTKKTCDFIVVNDITALGSEENEVWIVRKTDALHIPKASKDSIARAIVAEVYREILSNGDKNGSSEHKDSGKRKKSGAS
jgi:phosphopantothenoylcysteine decarboxylase/phosphopantothenate--cysteine ligase